MQELSVTTFINAPPEKVWDIMANRKTEWWCPLPWRAEFDVDDQRPGGQFDTTMYGPAGEVHPHRGIYLAFDEGYRFASTDAIVGDLEPSGPFMIGIWEIEPEGTGTRYIATARHWTAEARQNHADMGFEQGWSECARQLKELCEDG